MAVNRALVLGATGLAGLLVVVLTGAPIGSSALHVCMSSAGCRSVCTCRHAQPVDYDVAVASSIASAEMIAVQKCEGQRVQRALHACRPVQPARCAVGAAPPMWYDSSAPTRQAQFWSLYSAAWMGLLRRERRRSRSSCESSHPSWLPGKARSAHVHVLGKLVSLQPSSVVQLETTARASLCPLPLQICTSDQNLHHSAADCSILMMLSCMAMRSTLAVAYKSSLWTARSNARTSSLFPSWATTIMLPRMSCQRSQLACQSCS